MIPLELTNLNQWCVAGADKKPRDKYLNKASVTDPRTWMSWREAYDLCVSDPRLAPGFVLTSADPYACIDLDVKDAENCPDEPEKWTTPEQYSLYFQIMKGYNSYTETSRSGKGLHIWVRGNIGAGRRRDGVEIYSQDRFIICTGQIVNNQPIQDRQLMLANMVSQMPATGKQTDLEELPQVEDDYKILENCQSADNKDLFLRLWHKQIEFGIGKDYPSQSEADLALMSMFAFFSPSNEQCRRLFRNSELGKRPKATKNDVYVNRTLSIIRSRQKRESEIDLGPLLELARKTVENRKELALEELQRIHNESPVARSVAPLHSPELKNSVPTPSPTPVAVAMAGPVDASVYNAEGDIPWPPGFTGRIAQFIYQSAPRPVKEVAIVGALGLLCGMCGKAWHIPDSGLNQYIILVARSGVGKEAMHSGISRLIKTCTQVMPTFDEFVDFNEYVSGPALLKACMANPSFVNVSGEWGRRLRRMAADEREGPLATLRTQMTNLYSKSGPQSIAGGLGYSNQDKNVEAAVGVAYSMIGETTPGTFYESLTDSMMEDGFLSRFLIIEYKGKRPPANKNQAVVPDEALREGLIRLGAYAQGLLARNESNQLGRTAEAAQLIEQFELECDFRVNDTEDEARRQMWNRAALKVLRLCALLAVADNWLNPVVTAQHVIWSLDVVRRNIQMMSERINAGDVGLGDNARDRKLVKVMADYLKAPPSAGYKIDPKMHELGIIPRSYMQQKVSRHAGYYRHPRGSTFALDLSITNALVNGYIVEADKKHMMSAFKFRGKAYQIVELPDYMPREGKDEGGGSKSVRKQQKTKQNKKGKD